MVMMWIICAALQLIKIECLQSADGGEYHLSDPIQKHEIYKDKWLVVWR
jgi:hypothetical protein